MPITSARYIAAISVPFVLLVLNTSLAQAATHYYGYGYDRYSGSHEGTWTTPPDWAHGSHGLSSSAQKAIDDLDDDAVEKLPVPVLLGVSLTNITSNFGDPRDGGARTHEGEDILAPKDDYIVSPTDAVVVSMGTGESAGNYVYTANPGKETFAFMHLDRFANGLKAGSVLKPGDLIGYVGNTGDAAGGPTHLHFEIRHGKTPTDPFPRLARTFTDEERIEAVKDALDDAKDADADAR